MNLILPEYNPDAKCPKCGCAEIRTIYQKDAHGYVCKRQHPAGDQIIDVWGHRECCVFEHLDRVCTNCTYLWGERTVENGGEVPAAADT